MDHLFNPVLGHHITLWQGNEGHVDCHPNGKDKGASKSDCMGVVSNEILQNQKALQLIIVTYF